MGNKATIIEIHHDRAIVMTDQCDFKELKLKHPAEVGDTIDYLDKDLLNKPDYSRIPALVASVLLCCLLISSLLYKTPPGHVYAYVSFDINPSLQLGINKDYQVIEARGFNQDGQLLLNQGKISVITLDQAVSNIFKQTFDNLHLNRAQENYLLVTVYFPGDQVDAEFINNINNLLSEELGMNHVRATLFYFNIDKAAYERALEQNVSPGRWILWQTARESGFDFDLYGDLPWSENWLRELAYGNAQQIVRTASDNSINSMVEDKQNATNPEPVQKPADSTNKPSSGSRYNKQSSASEERNGSKTNDSTNSPGNGSDSTNSEPSSKSTLGNDSTAGSSIANGSDNAAGIGTTGSTSGSGSTGGSSGSNSSSGTSVSGNSSTESSGSQSSNGAGSSEGSGVGSSADSGGSGGSGGSGSAGGSSGSSGTGGGGGR